MPDTVLLCVFPVALPPCSVSQGSNVKFESHLHTQGAQCAAEVQHGMPPMLFACRRHTMLQKQTGQCGESF